MPATSRLRIQDLVLQISLGCTAQERSVNQEVRIGLVVQFSEGPWACETDRLEDTLCYAQVCNKITQVCAAKSYNTIEHLGFQCHRGIQELLPKNCRSLLTVHKVKPPIPNLQGGVIFSFGDPL